MINPCLPHAERVRLGLTPADPNYMPPKPYNPNYMPPKPYNPNYMPPKPYNPNTKIDAKARDKANEARPHLVLDVTTDDPVRTLTPAELEDLRFRMQRVQATTSGPNQLQAMRILTLIDQAEAAEDFTEAVSDAISNAELEDLEAAVTTAEDEITSEIDAEWEDRLTDELGDLKDPTPADLTSAFKVWHAAELKRISDSLADTFAPISKAIGITKASLDHVDPNA